MTTFDDREKAFENKFEHDMELQFKARARKNKMLGLWAAGLMGKTGDDAEAYARDIVMADFEKPGDHDVVHTLMHDLAAAGKPHRGAHHPPPGRALPGRGQEAGHDRGQEVGCCGPPAPWRAQDHERAWRAARMSRPD